MKRIISVAIVLSLVLSFNAFALPEEYSWLSSYGIIDPGFAAHNDSDTVTRADFAAALISVIGMEELLAPYTDIFSDVKEDTANARAIITLNEMNIMSGYSDGTFRPENEILYAEAVKMLVSLLGYAYKANASGGYPAGYLSVAAELKLLSGVSGSYSDKMTFANLIKLVDNALDVPVSEVSGVGENLTYTVDKSNTLLYKYHDMKKDKGIVTANPYAAISGYFVSGENSLRIGGEEYFVSEESCFSYIGQTVEFVYSIDKSTGDKKIISVYPAGNNRTQTISAEDYINLSGNTITYNDNEKTKTISFTDMADVIYNGKNGEISKNILDNIKTGSITLVSTSRSSSYDLVIIKDYKEMKVGKIDETNRIIYNADDSSDYIELDENSKTVRIFDSKGKAVNFKFISVDDIINYAINDDYCEVYAVSDAFSGIVSMISSDNRGTTYTIGDNTLRLSKAFEEKGKAINSGSNVKAFLNSFGQIAEIRVLSKSGYEFVYLFKAGGKSNGPDEKVSVKVYIPDKGVKTYALENNIFIDDILIKEITGEKLLKALNNETEKMIGIKLSEDEKISAIINPGELSEMEEKGEDGFVRTHKLAQRRYYKDPPQFARTTIFAKTTPVIQIPLDVNSASDNDFRMNTPAVFPEGMVWCEIYSSSVDYTIPDFIVHRTEGGPSSAPEFVYETPIVTLKEKKTVLDEDGVAVLRYTVQNGYKEDFFYINGDAPSYSAGGKKYTFSDSESGDNIIRLEKGDMIRFRKDAEGYIRRLEVLYDYSEDNWLYSANVEGRGYVKTTVSKVVDTYVYVPYWYPASTTTGVPDDYYGCINLSEATLSIGGVTIVTEREGQPPVVSAGTAADVSKGDKIIIHLAYGQLIGVIIMR